MAGSVEESALPTPDTFAFPFKPYDIQIDFMKALYRYLEDSSCGILESPTGTGKSMSLICGALKWLEDHKQREESRMKQLVSAVEPRGPVTTCGKSEARKAADTDEPAWLTAYDEYKAQQDETDRLKRYLEQKAKQEARFKDLKWRSVKNRGKGKRMREGSDDASESTALDEGTRIEGEGGGEEDADIVLPEYYSGEEEEEEEGGEMSDDADADLEADWNCKIFYCSRTHSQLSQFVQEVKKSPYGSRVRVVALASRQSMCINEKVRRLGSSSLINERCLELQKNKRKAAHPSCAGPKRRKTAPQSGCPHYKPDRVEDLSGLALAEVQDIEQLVSKGRGLGACPYYSSRRALRMAELIVVPYNTLLHAPTRKAVGISLKGNVVIIDEAHNLLDTISNIHSVHITGTQVAKAFSQLTQYRDRFRERLKAKNLMYVMQILQILEGFLKFLKSASPSGAGVSQPVELQRLYKLNDFLFDAGIDNLNLFKILTYCERSRISQKLNGFVDKYFELLSAVVTSADPPSAAQPHSLPDSNKTSDSLPTASTLRHQQEQQSRSSPLVLIEAFISSLTNKDENGRVSVTLTGELHSSSLRFFLLNPAVHFAEVVHECRAVIVAGGTMQPVSEFKEQLFFSLGVPQTTVREFSCGHVIPDKNLLAVCLSKGPSGVQFDFTFRSRDTPEQLSELGRSVVNLCSIVPGGLVCFFPSYEHERNAFAFWQQSGILDSISKKKQIFREPRLASQLDTVLTQYARCAKSNAGNIVGLNGAVLLSVVGGKMSEGINFSDELGRCIIMVGLPYPNMKSAELEEKMKYLDKAVAPDAQGRKGGQVHYENLCMKAVNQSIGRAIRHAEDYAVVLLVDHRYSRPGVQERLPQWMGRSLSDCASFGLAFSSIRKFFQGKKATTVKASSEHQTASSNAR